MSKLTIGELSRLTGVKVTTIRYYESTALLREPPRTPAGRRSYGVEHVRRLNFIRHARDLGFAANDICELLALTDTPEQSCLGADAIARRHLREVEEKIARLDRLRLELKRMIGQCRRGRIAECRIIDTLADHARCTTGHGALRSL